MKHAWIPLSLLALASSAFAEGTKYAHKPAPAGVPAATPQPVTSFINGSDSCTTPDVIAGLGPHGFDNSAATTGAEGQTDPLCLAFGSTAIDQDVWFSWTAPSSGTAFLDICSSGSTVDTKVAVYSGSGCPSGPAIGCNDDACPGLQSNVTFPCVAGNPYTIQVGTYPGAGGGVGSFTFTISAGPGNDSCTTPQPIAGPGPHAYDTTFATTGTQGQANSRCFIFNTSAIQSDVWYTWTAAASGWVAVDTCTGGQHDLRVAVYAGAGCPVGEPIICDDDACGTIGASSRAPFLATAGQSYTIQVGSYPGQAGAPGFFTLSPFTPAAGDSCSAPIDIAGAGPFNWDNFDGVTGQEGQNEALCSNEMITHDLWYRWTSYCTSNVTVTLCALSSLDTKVAVYSGSGCPASSALACNDDACAAGGPSSVTFAAVDGQTYMIQLGCWPGETPGAGAFTITTSCPPPTGTVYCIGDGQSPHTACPCGNNSPTAAGVGCLNSLGSGGRLRAFGNPSLTDDNDGSASVTLIGNSMPNSSCLYFQGTAMQNAGNGSVFGDGLRCAAGSILRLDTESNVAGTSQYPNPSQPLPLSVRGNVLSPGTRTYQAWYRNAAAFCTASTFNLSNGVEIVWAL